MTTDQEARTLVLDRACEFTLTVLEQGSQWAIWRLPDSCEAAVLVAPYGDAKARVH
jgi:hypothetical protein